MKPKRKMKKTTRTHSPKVLSSGEATRGDILPEDVEETTAAVLGGVQALVFLAHGHSSETIRHKAGSALVDILKQCFLEKWNTQSANSHLNVNLLMLRERNEGFKKRHGELYSRRGKGDSLGGAVRTFTCELWFELMFQENMAASLSVLKDPFPPEVLGRRLQPKPMPLFDAWARSVDAYRNLPVNPTTTDIDRTVMLARLEHFESYWRDVFSKAAQNRHQQWWALTIEPPSKEDAAIIKHPIINPTRFKELQAARDNPPEWIEIVKHEWRDNVENRVNKAVFDWIAKFSSLHRTVKPKSRRK
jgi:hypothetical protein